MFNFLRYGHTVLQSGYTISHSHSSAQVVPIYSDPHQNLLFPGMVCFLVCVFLVVDILMGTNWYLFVVSICISLRISDVECLFMCLLAICVSSLEKSLFNFFAHSLIGLLSKRHF